jgi:arylsulfatase A-like enzyme
LTRWFPPLALASLGCLVHGPALARNYLVVLADDLGVDKVASYVGDYPTFAPQYTPDTLAIDSLEGAGIRFTKAWAEPLCSPTRAALQTGAHPFRSAIGQPLANDDPGVDPNDFVMIAEELGSQGFATGYFGKWHLGSGDATGATGLPEVTPFLSTPHPALSGWSRFYGTYDGVIGDFEAWTSVSWDALLGAGDVVDETTMATVATTDHALDWIADQTDPWLAFVAYHAPHSPGADDAFAYGDAEVDCYRSAELACLDTESCGDEGRSVYQALVECMDLELETLLGSIDPDVLDDTLIVFLGDNGTPRTVAEDDFLYDWNADGQPDQNRGKGTVYETGVGVPLLVADGLTWRTGVTGAISSPGRVSSAPVEVVDVYETLYIDAIGLGSGSTDANDFTDCFTDSTDKCGRVVNEYGYAEKFVLDSSGEPLAAAVGVRWGGDKLVAIYDADEECLQPTYYNLTADPFEKTPRVFKGNRATRLKGHVTTLHDGTGSWGDGIGFCK